MGNIIEALKKTVPLPAEECRRFLSITSTAQLDKGDYWIETGKMNIIWK
jgi:hypothetical protein